MKMHRQFKALIFDLDGTLVDSAEIARRTMLKWSDEMNVRFSELEDTLHSSRTEDTVRRIAPQLDAKKEAARIEAMESEALTSLKEINGASILLRQLPTERWAIATSCNLSTAIAKLSATNMPIPNVLIGADAVRCGKPEPEPYLFTCKALGFNPNDCLAFEDSGIGIESALKAGCHVIVVGSSRQIHEPRIIGSIRDFREIDFALTKSGTIEISFRPL